MIETQIRVADWEIIPFPTDAQLDLLKASLLPAEEAAPAWRRWKARGFDLDNATSFVSPELPGDLASRFSAPAEPQPGHLSGVALVRADVFARVGPLDAGYQPASEMEWWLRARDQGVDIYLLDDVILRRRIHDKNSSLRDSTSFNEVSLKIAREALRRKRAGSS